MTYGAWITPNGRLIEVKYKFTHNRYCHYSDAHADGWIGATYPQNKRNDLCFRVNPRTATVKALGVAIDMIKDKKPEAVYIESAFAGMLTINGERIMELRPSEAKQLLNEIRLSKLSMDDSWEFKL